MKQRLQGSVFLLLATVIWGNAFVAQSVGMDHIGPFTFQAIRCGLAVLVLIPMAFLFDGYPITESLKRWRNPKLWKAGVLCGGALFIATSLQQIGLIDTNAGKAGFLTALYIVLVPLFGIFIGKKPPICAILSVGLAVAGLYCLSCVGVSQISPGDLCLIGCAAAFAVQILCVDRFAGVVDALRLNCVQALTVTVLSIPFMWLGESVSWTGIWICRGPLAFAGILSMGLAYSFQIHGQKLLEPTSASLIMSLESVFAVLGGCLLLREAMTGWEIIGCGLVFLAVILSQLPLNQFTKEAVTK